MEYINWSFLSLNLISLYRDALSSMFSLLRLKTRLGEKKNFFCLFYYSRQFQEYISVLDEVNYLHV